MRYLFRLLFYPTLLWNIVLSRIIKSRRWWDWIDNSVLLGALPFPSDVSKLKALGIGAVVNTCDEYAGSVTQYAAAGIEQCYIPTVDFTPPALADLETSVRFIHAQIAAGKKVYVHCKAGRGRSATVVACYLLTRGHTPESAQRLMLEKRPHVNALIYKRPVVLQFAALEKSTFRK
ncbi:MAG: dual specificity protein phosphatase family protein [Planctomycetota bacterium]